MGLSSSDLASIRLTVNSFLPDTATIVRTGVTVAARVADDKRDERFTGLPHIVRMRRWRIVLPDAQDVRGGDTIAVPGKGAYYVLDTGNPRSYSVQTTAFCLMTYDAAGNAAAPLADSVTFTNPTRGETFTTAALVYPASFALTVFPDAALYRWAAVYDAAHTYPSGAAVGSEHEITWHGIDRTATVKGQPLPLLPQLPYSLVFFGEMP